MHAFDHQNYTFIHEGDFSGDVEIMRDGKTLAFVQTSALIAFVAEFVRCKKIQELESASDREVLGLREKS